MNILITGNMGYVGSVLVKYLKKNLPNINLIGFDSGFFAHSLTVENSIPEKNINKQIFSDLRNVKENDLENIDAIVHLAALSNDPMGNYFNKLTREININASKRLFKLAVKNKIKRFIFASSCSVYGKTNDESINENSQLDPLTAYSKSKIHFENFIRDTDSKNTKITSLRFATACGYSERLRLDLVLNDFVVSAVKNKRIDILSRGDQWRPLIDVEDMARAIHWGLIRKDLEKYIVVNAGSNKWNFKIIELAEKVSKIIPNTKINFNKNAPADHRSYKVDFSLFKSLAPNYQPKKTIEQTINKLSKSINNLNIQQDFRNSNLIRLKMLEDHIFKKRLNKKLIWKNN